MGRGEWEDQTVKDWMNVGESEKLIKRRRIKNERVRAKNRWMMWHNKRVVTLNSTFQLLDIYRLVDSIYF